MYIVASEIITNTQLCLSCVDETYIIVWFTYLIKSAPLW